MDRGGRGGTEGLGRAAARACGGSDPSLVLGMLALGLALAFVSSIALGPINLHLLHLVQTDARGAIAAFLVGVIGADVLIAFVALHGLQAAGLTPGILRLLGIAGGVFLLAYAAVTLLRAARGVPLPAGTSPRVHCTSNVLLGLLFCGLNPGFYVFWAFGASIAVPDMAPGTLAAAAPYLLGVVLGDASWFLVFLSLAGRWGSRLHTRRWTTASGVGLGVLGVYTVVRSLA